jgi:predicted dienelactone hydrolase
MKTLICMLLLSAVAAAAPPSTNIMHVTIAGRDVAVWKPAGNAPDNGFPVILFSHGYTGCNTQSIFLMEALAQAGYLVLAPSHADAQCRDANHKDGAAWYPGKMLDDLQKAHPQESFRDPDKWSDAIYKDRVADMEAVLDGVLREKSFLGVPVDSQRVGVSGHSLGGYTALGMAGAWPSWKDKRFKAVLALSPHCSPFVAKGTLGAMGVPVMYQGGTRDLGETPIVKRPNGAYDKSAAPKYYVEFDGAGHFAWTNINKTYQEVIAQYSVAFFDRYLKPQPASDRLDALTKKPLPKGVSDVRADARQ